MKTVTLPYPYGGHCARYGFSSSSSSSSSLFYNIVIAMGKRNKRSPQAPEDSDPALRITSSVKQNLQMLKLLKESQNRKTSTPKPATGYRKKKARKKVIPEDKEIYRDSTSSLYYTKQVTENASPVLIVDGYNVCGYWTKLKNHFLNGRLDIARQKLIDELVTFRAARGVKVVVVFDALMSRLPTNKETFSGVDVVYTGESYADTWIMKEVTTLKKGGCRKVWVATSDLSQQEAVLVSGALVWSCKKLVSEIMESQKDMETMLKEQRRTPFQGTLLKHNLNSKIAKDLCALRKKLSENESKRK